MLRWAVRGGLALAVLALVYLGVTFGQVLLAAGRDDAQSAQAIIVLGAAQYDGEPSPVFRARLDHAAELFELGLAPLVVVTGGNRPGDRFTEGIAGYRYLLAGGVPEEALVAETTGVNSWSSVAAAARILRRDGITEVLLVSSPYHSLRLLHIADEVGLEGHASPVDDSPEGLTSVASHYLQETVAVGIGRVIGYGRLVRLDERVQGG